MSLNDVDNMIISNTAGTTIDTIESINPLIKAPSKIWGLASVLTDVHMGIDSNLQSGASNTRIVSDAAVDVALTTDMLLASAAAGSGSAWLYFTYAGSVVPGIGNIIGLGAGAALSIYLWYKVDYQKDENGQTLRERLKDTQYDMINGDIGECPND